jgi:hypothetical protein
MTEYFSILINSGGLSGRTIGGIVGRFLLLGLAGFFCYRYRAGKRVHPTTDAVYCQTRYSPRPDQAKPRPVLIDAEEPVRTMVRYPDLDVQQDVIETCWEVEI